MSRVQLALNVSNLEEAIAFYSKLFGTAPSKVREGYANFAIAEPPLKLVLLENAGAPGTMNHLGVEVESTDQVGAAIARLQSEGLDTVVEGETTCCFAVQDKVWVNAPDGEPWEVYTVLADAPTMKLIPLTDGDAACCAPAAADSTGDAGSSCG
ncbi:MAG: glyoxalase/bleomycin resistance/dioxygenase family protein [Actinobacteria bacterium]|nr:glyoxalase/bleomycin resistance/dioxygenase family protein [Actinomycetota bacterium]